MAKNDYLRDLLNEIKLRYQLGEEDSTESFLPLSITHQLEDSVDSQQLEFALQLKILEVKKLTDFLENISLKSERERMQWVDSHQQFVDQLSQLIIQDSNLSLVALKGSNGNSQLSLILAEEVKKAISLMNTIFFDDSVLDA